MSGTDGPTNRLGSLSIAPQLVHGAPDGPPGGPGPVFAAGDLLGLADDDARGLGGLFPDPGIGGEFLCRVAGDMAQQESHGAILADRARRRQGQLRCVSLTRDMTGLCNK